ncbi:hypothetical protein RvY_02141 [Ramazzottius varieornatus]|uniref:Secreted protein n=1 Tax=Ramazzottius varieornatus TaxID=947166 RepID=A0A1D1UIR1_RAMVA|nr:hypothetical protein RvY_02141 [Ramazzottius varieornatus]
MIRASRSWTVMIICCILTVAICRTASIGYRQTRESVKRWLLSEETTELTMSPHLRGRLREKRTWISSQSASSEEYRYAPSRESRQPAESFLLFFMLISSSQFGGGRHKAFGGFGLGATEPPVEI